jgi:hypothetical protein
MSDDNSLLSTTVYGIFCNSDVPAGYVGFSDDPILQKYAYAQFDRNVTVFGNIFCNSIQGFTTDLSGAIVSSGNVAIADSLKVGGAISGDTIAVTDAITGAQIAVTGAITGASCSVTNSTVTDELHALRIFGSDVTFTNNLYMQRPQNTLWITFDEADPSGNTFLFFSENGLGSIYQFDGEVHAEKMFSTDLDLTNNLYMSRADNKLTVEFDTEVSNQLDFYCTSGADTVYNFDGQISCQGIVHSGFAFRSTSTTLTLTQTNVVITENSVSITLPSSGLISGHRILLLCITAAQTWTLVIPANFSIFSAGTELTGSISRTGNTEVIYMSNGAWCIR